MAFNILNKTKTYITININSKVINLLAMFIVFFVPVIASTALFVYTQNHKPSWIKYKTQGILPTYNINLFSNIPDIKQLIFSTQSSNNFKWHLVYNGDKRDKNYTNLQLAIKAMGRDATKLSLTSYNLPTDLNNLESKFTAPSSCLLLDRNGIVVLYYNTDKLQNPRNLVIDLSKLFKYSKY